MLARGRVIKELGFRRSDLVISTKIFWGTRKGPNDAGLSRKQYVLAFNRGLFLLHIPISIIEGAKESLARLQLDYVDVILAHRCDPNGSGTAVSLMPSLNPDPQYRWRRLFAPSTS